MAKNIVVLGAGFGGLKAACHIAKQLRNLSLENDYRVILIDRNNFHTFTPLLYEIATASKRVANYLELKSLVAYPLEELLKNKGVIFAQEEVIHVDIAERFVHLRHGQLSFNYLLIALGSETNYFDIPGLRENSLPLKTFHDAIRIRDRLEMMIESNETDLKIVVGGGGSTGVEIASEIQEWIGELREKNRITCNTNLIIIEAGPGILTAFDKKVVRRIEERLEKLKVKVMAGKAIREVRDKKIFLSDNTEILFDVLIWTGGVKAASLTKHIPLKKGGGDRIEIVSALECLPESSDLRVYGTIYAIGDIACIYDPRTNRPVPQVARAAIAQGKIAAMNIIENIKKETGLNPKTVVHIYRPITYPFIIPVGGKYAVATIGPFVISGTLAWIFKGLIELIYLASIMPFGKALKIWLKGLRIFIQNDRLG